MKEFTRNLLEFVHFSTLYWEKSACQASEEQESKLKSSHTIQGKGPFVTKQLWTYVKVYILRKPRRFLLCAVFLSPGTAECAQMLGT